MVQKRKWTEAQVQRLMDEGLVPKFLREPRARKKLVLYDGVTGWEKWVSRRVGLLGKKLGMRGEVDLWGNVHPVTLLQLQDNEVLRVKRGVTHQKKTDDEYVTMQVGAGLRKWKNLSRAEIGQFAALDCDPKEVVREFRVSANAVVPEGTKLLPTHFVVGQFVDVRARTKGKGTAGVMKRHGFAGGPASHGASKVHRAAGSIASGAEHPGHVFKGTKMAGRMGGEYRTTYSLQILKINTVDQILYVRGSIPGPKGSWIEIRDAVKTPHRLPPPYPTHLPNVQKNRPLAKKKYIRWDYPDPYKRERSYDWETRWAEARIALKSAQQGGLLEGEEDIDDEALF